MQQHGAHVQGWLASQKKIAAHKPFQARSAHVAAAIDVSFVRIRPALQQWLLQAFAGVAAISALCPRRHTA